MLFAIKEFSREQLSAISAIHRKFALMAEISLSKRLGSCISIRVASVDQLFMKEFFGVIPIPSTLGIISMEPIGSAVLQIDNELIEQWRELGGIGEKIMEDIYSMILENLREAWLGVADIQPKLEKVEYEPQFIKIASPEEWVLLVTFKAKRGMLNLCIPYSALELVLEQRKKSIVENAERGDASCQYQMGDWHAKGEFVEMDKAKAFEWFRKSAEQGYMKAQYRMGFFYNEGLCGAEQDDAKAFEWYQKAAEQGHEKAQYKLGKLYAKGRGVAQNLDKAAEWYQKAAAKGVDMAAVLLERIKNGDTDTSTFAERMT